MTRLIDADELVNELHKHFSIGFDEDEWWNSSHVLIAIEWTSTVDAIPVEWIKKYMSRCLAIEQDAIGEMVKEWAEREEE